MLGANRNRLLVRNRVRRCCSGHPFARVIQHFGVWTQKIQANVDYWYVWRREVTRRVRFARPWTRASKPALIDPSLAAKRRAAALHVFYFIQASEPSTD